MTPLAKNIKHLRSELELTQAVIAEKLSVSREIYSKYENARSEPPIGVLRKLSALFRVSIDLLVGVDLQKIDRDALLKLDGNRILLPIQVAPDNENMIEVVTYTASAGYLTGYSDPEFIEQLDTIKLPFLDKGKLRAFPIKGDSMLPLQDGSYVIGRYLENLRDYLPGQTYVVVTSDEGIVYKRIFQDAENGSSLILHSDNEVYDPYSVSMDEVVEMWQFVCSISLKQPNENPPTMDQIISMLRKLKVK